MRVQPIYSQHTRGGGKGVNNVHKFERYLRHGVTTVATTYGPVTFGKQPCVLLRETSDTRGEPSSSLPHVLIETKSGLAPQLVALGTFLNPDTTRIIAKRYILTGHPLKVHKKTATVRYMFFNSGEPSLSICWARLMMFLSEDVEYFKPIQLQTKYGRTGHIRESLGTHGYFKAHFDGAISQMDTVCMSLYKRVFPKWGELWRVDRNIRSDAMEE
jgi:pre-rRNA-processing protein TSR1